MTELRVEVLHEAGAFEALRAQWDGLLERSDASVFQSWEWLSCCRRHLSPRGRLHLVTVRDGERLVGLAPMETAPLGPVLRRLRFVGTGPTDYLDFVLDRERAPDALDAILAHLEEHARRWAAIDLHQVPAASLTAERWRTWRPRGLNTRDVDQEVCPYLPLGASWEEAVGKKRRGNLSYYERLAARDFECTLFNVGSEELSEALEAMFRLHAARWRKRGLPGVLAGSRKKAFHREVALLMLERGWLRLQAVRLDGRLESLLYCLARGDRSYYYMGGWNPELARYSLGTVLTGRAIRMAIEESCVEFDFLRGDEPYKAAWTTSHRTNRRLVAYRPTPPGRAGYALCRAEHEMEQRGKAWLHRRLNGPTTRG